ncbi:MAG: RNA polymerase sigma factor [Myxococcota bacterium]
MNHQTDPTAKPHPPWRSASSPPNLKEMVLKAVDGDQAAARWLFDTHQRRVMAYSLLSAGDREIALDLTQETFKRAFAQLGSLRDPERFGPWLMRIAASICARSGHSRTRERHLLELYRMECGLRPRADDDPEARERRIACVQRLLEEIQNPKVRQIVMMKYTEPEHTTRAIAAALGLPHGTVTVTLSRFRATIKAKMAQALLDQEVHR